MGLYISESEYVAGSTPWPADPKFITCLSKLFEMTKGALESFGLDELDSLSDDLLERGPLKDSSSNFQVAVTLKSHALSLARVLLALNQSRAKL